ncbi:uncharacterized protein [Diabrotica undecimpunctata]|uniref:uncharacterized protein n=1 Tax=Diabrotica undecimpunctata TaxID=50387 RepID=UPI003B641EF9
MFQYICFVFVTGLACGYSTPCPKSSVEVEVPNSVQIGDSATLVCNFKPKTEEDVLNNVRWFKENDEFYRFTPDEKPPMKVFILPGITVDEKRSSAKTVVLKNVQNQLTANYTCEASWTVPSIATAKDSKQMYVVDELKGEIILTVENENPGYGDELHGVCITPPSKIAPTFTWFLNGIQDYSWSSQATRKNSNVPKRFTSFYNQRVAFVDDRANLTCVVKIDNIYKTQKSVILKRNDNQGGDYFNRDYSVMSGSSTTTIDVSIFVAVLLSKLWSLF